MTDSLRHRFPGAIGDWARFDGPAGTQMVDTAIDAAAQWARSGNTANTGGAFAAAKACDALLEEARETVGELLGGDPAGVCFGANMTTMTFAFSRAVSATLAPGDRVVGTRLDHDANIWPWHVAAEQAGAEHVLAPFDPSSGQLAPDSVIDLIDERTRWVTVPGASNLIGTVPDLAPIIDAAHSVGARVFVDAVHLVPHHPVDLESLRCDVLATSPYKWYGPHAGVLWIDPELLDKLPIAKVRPAAETGPRRFETGTPNFEAIAAVSAAARFLLDEGMNSIRAAEAVRFRPLLDGLMAMPGVQVHGPATMSGRCPTIAFTIDGRRPDDVVTRLAEERIAAWAGDSYAVEVISQLGLADSGGVIRAGISRYVERDDVDRLLRVVEDLIPPTGW